MSPFDVQGTMKKKRLHHPQQAHEHPQDHLVYNNTKKLYYLHLVKRIQVQKAWLWTWSLQTLASNMSGDKTVEPLPNIKEKVPSEHPHMDFSHPRTFRPWGLAGWFLYHDHRYPPFNSFIAFWWTRCPQSFTVSASRGPESKNWTCHIGKNFKKIKKNINYSYNSITIPAEPSLAVQIMPTWTQ